MRIELLLSKDGWTVTGPNGQYRTCSHFSELHKIIEATVLDYARWIVEMTGPEKKIFREGCP